MKSAMYKGFKKIQEDEKTATFEHEKGHKLTLLKGGLDGSERKNLSKLPLYQADPEEPIPSPSEQSSREPAAETPQAKDVNITINSGAPSPQPQSFVDKFAPQVEPMPANPQRMAMLEHAQEPAPVMPATPADIGLVPQETESAPQANPQPASIPEPAPQMPSAPAPMQAHPQISAPTPNGQPLPLSTQLANVNDEYNRYMAAQTHADEEFQEATKKEGGIDSRRVFKNMDTPKKISTAIGLILGGIGGALTGQENPALKMLNKQIDNDIEDQKADKSEKFNLFKMHLASLGNQAAASLQTGINLRQSALTKMDEALGNVGSGPMAQQRIAAAKASLQSDIAKSQAELAQFHLTKSLRDKVSNGNMQGQDPAQLVRVLVPEPHQKKVFEEIERAQNTKHMGQNIMDAFEQAAKENTVLRTGAGLLRTPGSVYALHQHMQPTFGDLEGTVRQAAMDNTFKNVTPMPGDMEHTVEQKRQALRQYLQSKSSAPTAKGFGIDLSKFDTTAPIQAPPVARKTASGKVALFDPQTKAFIRYQ